MLLDWKRTGPVSMTAKEKSENSYFRATVQYDYEDKLWKLYYLYNINSRKHKHSLANTDVSCARHNSIEEAANDAESECRKFLALAESIDVEEIDYAEMDMDDFLEEK